MPFFKITYNTHRGMDRACIYNWGCNFRCKGCSYKLRPSARNVDEKKELGFDEVRETLIRIKPKRVHFLGGEPTTNPCLPELARFAHEELGAVTKIGHTNGSGRIPDYIDEVSFSIKAYSNHIHEEYTGESNVAVLKNFKDAHSRGKKVSASSVLIPGIIGADEVGRVAAYVGTLDRRVTFHITPYIPVPGVPYPAPCLVELDLALEISRQHLDNVNVPQFGIGDFAKFYGRDLLYQSRQVA